MHASRPVTAPVRSRRRHEDENEGGSLERFIAQELSKEPYELELNAASFCYMSKEVLHEILDKILETVCPEKMESIYIADDKTDQIIEFLKILRYKPNGTEVTELEKLRDGIEEADMNVMIPLLAWLLANMPTLKTRAYLSKYLIKIKVPDELMCDEDIATLYSDYEAEIEKFKRTHKLRESMAEKRPLAQLKKEIQEVQLDIECLTRKAEMTKAKVAHVEDGESIVELIRQLRLERSRQNELIDQEAIEHAKLNRITGRKDFLATTLKELRTTNESLTPKSLIDREIQEVANVRSIVTETLPKAIGKVRRKIRSIRTVVEDMPRSVNDLEEIRLRVQALEGENAKLESVLAVANAKEDGREVLITRKKADNVRGRAMKLREHLKSLEENYEVVKSELTQKSFDALTKKQRDEDDQIYVSNLRSKAKIYKEKKAELHAIRTKVENLRKTEQNMGRDFRKCKQNDAERQEVQGLDDGAASLNYKKKRESAKKVDVDTEKQGILDQYSESGIALNSDLEMQKNRLQPLLKAVDGARQQTLLLSMEHRQMKHKYELVTQDNHAQDLTELKKVQDEISEKEMEILKLSLDTKFKQFELDRAFDGTNGYGRRSFKEKLLGKLIEEERIQKSLIEEDAELVRNEANSQKQLKMYEDLVTLLKCKKEIYSEDASFHQEEEGD